MKLLLPTLLASSLTAQAQLTSINQGDTPIPVAVVRGTPYEMGHQLGTLVGEQIRTFVPPALAAITAQLGITQADLQQTWSRTAAYTDDRVEQEIAGLADASGLPLATLQALHAVPLLMPYSCSSIAAWDTATADGHLLQSRNLDWSLEVGAHEFPVIVVYLPDHGTPHVVPTFAGMVGAHTGMNAAGITLAEMGDSPASEAPYNTDAPHFTTYFRTILYDATSLTATLDIFKRQPLTKRYHFVFGDGRHDHRAVKIRAHAPEPEGQRLRIWTDNDPTDEFAPQVLPDIVYNDEGRGAFPTLKNQHGQLTPKKLIDLANQIPIKGGNVTNVIYDATALQLWVTYAKGDQEAYQLPYAHLDLKTLDANADGRPDITTP